MAGESCFGELELRQVQAEEYQVRAVAKAAGVWQAEASLFRGSHSGEATSYYEDS